MRWGTLFSHQHGLLRDHVIDVDAKPFGNAAAVCRICFQEVPICFS
jgi:hypothetical protein